MIEIRSGRGAYPLEFLGVAECIAALPADSFIVTDSNVAASWPLLEPFEGRVMILPPGEGAKSFQTFAAVHSWLANAGASRKSTVVALGGGVIGDLVGFVAATFMRGVRFVQVPTTLLSQVDSSVGGKVAIDIPEGKNLVGSFYPPNHVYVCTEFLDTLPLRQINNGMAEVWKYGFIMDSNLVELLATDQIARDEIVKRCISLKAVVVEEDEFETTGRRAILNFGHTVGHAVEQVSGYGPILHGEAIAIGMVAEAELGESIGVTERGTASKIERYIASQGLPTRHELLGQADRMLSAMKRDKKAARGVLAFSLLTKIGGCKLVEGVSEGMVRSVLEDDGRN